MIRNRESKLPQSVAQILNIVCESNESGHYQPPNLLIPINSGNGRTHIVRTIADFYHEHDARSFSSRDYYLEFKLSGTVTNINETHLEIQEYAEYANHYNGVVALDIDALLPHLNDMIGEKFFNMANSVKRHATIIIYVPADCQTRQIDVISNKIGASLRPLNPIEPSSGDMVRVFLKNMSQKNLKEHITTLDSKEREQVIAEFISEIPHPSMRKIIELAKSMPFNAEAYKKLSEKVQKMKEVLQ